jgi:hypothetical protein
MLFPFFFRTSTTVRRGTLRRVQLFRAHSGPFGEARSSGQEQLSVVANFVRRSGSLETFIHSDASPLYLLMVKKAHATKGAKRFLYRSV